MGLNNTRGLFGGNRQTKLTETAYRTAALHKMSGNGRGGFAFNGTPATESKIVYTNTIKLQVDAPFSAVQLLALNRNATAITGLKAMVGVTETADRSNGTNLGVPVINGVGYPALAGATNVNGFMPITWAGANSGSMGVATTAPTIAISDRIPVSSIPRTDGGAGYLLLQRTCIDGTVTPFQFNQYSNLLRTPTAAARNRILQSSCIFVDGVSNPGFTNWIDANISHEVWPILHYNTPVFSVWSVGDSISQCDMLVADYASTWVYRACMDLSTEKNPVIFANFGASSQTASTYFSIARQHLAAGVPPPSCLVISPISVNDAALNPRLASEQLARATEAVKLAQDYRIPYLIMFPWMPNENYTAAQEDYRLAANKQIKQFCSINNITFIEFPGMGNGAYPEKYKDEYRYLTSPSVHPNELCIENVMTVSVRTAIASLL